MQMYSWPRKTGIINSSPPAPMSKDDTSPQLRAPKFPIASLRPGPPET